jgi:glucosamine-6-phosphate isomerase
MNILKFDSEQAWVEGAASLWRDRLRTNPRLRMCLPSGHTPNKIFAAMGQAVKARQVSFREAEIFCLDDFGGLAKNDPGRCANMLRHYLLSGIDLPEKQFHWIDIDAADLSKVCSDYDRAIEPGFDLTLLGLGLNGHLGMNEPGSAADSPTRRVELASTTVASSAKYLTHANLPTWGITVGLKQLLGSKEVWLLANGNAKAPIIKRTVTGAIGEEVPASLLRRHPHSFLMADAEAAREI